MAEKKMVLGVKRLKGTSEKGPYDFTTVFCAEPVEVSSGAKMEASGYGLEVVEMRGAAECLEAFKGLKFPAEVELVTEPRKVFGKYETVCVGVVAAAAARRVA
jgi:hypothetical protein